MDKHYNEALAYLSSPAGSFWKWDDNGAVVVWRNGSTIAFREEVAAVLQRLAIDGLPPLDVVLLMIAATRVYWRADSRELRDWFERDHLDRETSHQSSARVETFFSRLDPISDLPEFLKGSAESKAELAAVVFENSPRAVFARTATIVCEILSKRFNAALPSLPKLRGGRAMTTKSLRKDLWLWLEELGYTTTESLQNRLPLRYQTGLDSVPEAAPVQIPIEQPAMRAFLSQLSLEREFAGLARLTRNLAAVVQLPRAVTDTDELPLGGVSDLSNRGTLDRLLVSELAQDDLMLATRVALNEALYLRREAPPGFPPRHRHVLIDAGLRMWGVPRVFATAVLMSLAATLDKDSSLCAFRASGDDVIAVDVASRDGLVAHLAALEPDAHPGRSLSTFFQRVHDSDLPGDAILVTTDAVLDDAEFQRSLSDTGITSLFVATVHRDGTFHLWSLVPRGRKCHSTLRLDLDSLFTSPTDFDSPQPKLIDSSADSNGPAILRTKPFPFRLPYARSSLEKSSIWSIWNKSVDRIDREPVTREEEVWDNQGDPLERTVFILTRTFRLLMFDQGKTGGVLLGEGLPFGECHCSWWSDEPGQSFALIYRQSDRTLNLFSIDAFGRSVQSRLLTSQKLMNPGKRSEIVGATAHGAVLFVIFDNGIECFNISTATLVASTESSFSGDWKGQRFFASRGSIPIWWAMSFDGVRIQFEEVPLQSLEKLKNVRIFEILSVIERRGTDGPYVMTTQGRLLNLSDPTEIQLWPEIGKGADMIVQEIDSDGSRIVVVLPKSRDPFSVVVVDMSLGIKLARMNQIEKLAAFDARRLDFGGPLMRRFASVSVRNEQLTLISNGDAACQFRVKANRLVMTNQAAGSKQERLVRDFQPCQQSKASLRVAEWDDGSRAWIDPRGMLHLQSSDPEIPEASFLLCGNQVAVWTNEGKVHGSRYHIEKQDVTRAVSPKEVIERILLPFVSKLR